MKVSITLARARPPYANSCPGCFVAALSVCAEARQQVQTWHVKFLHMKSDIRKNPVSVSNPFPLDARHVAPFCVHFQ